MSNVNGTSHLIECSTGCINFLDVSLNTNCDPQFVIFFEEPDCTGVDSGLINYGGCWDRGEYTLGPRADTGNTNFTTG